MFFEGLQHRVGGQQHTPLTCLQRQDKRFVGARCLDVSNRVGHGTVEVIDVQMAVDQFRLVFGPGSRLERTGRQTHAAGDTGGQKTSAGDSSLGIHRVLLKHERGMPSSPDHAGR